MESPDDIVVTSDMYYIYTSYNNKVCTIDKDGKTGKEYTIPSAGDVRSRLLINEKGMFVHKQGRWVLINDETMPYTGAENRYTWDSASTDEKMMLFNSSTKKEVELDISDSPSFRCIRDFEEYSLVELSYSSQAEDGTMQMDNWLCLIDDSGIISKIQIPESLKSDEYVKGDIFALPNGNVYKLRLSADKVEVMLIATI